MLKLLKEFLAYRQDKKQKEKKIAETPLPAKQMQFAFVAGGKCYYKYTDEMLMPVERALSAQDVMTELDCKVDREYLKMFCKTVLELANKGKFSQVAILTDQLQGRLNHISNVELLYKLASVVYVQEDEDPYNYDLAFAEQKIKHWKEHEKDIDTFFLTKAISEYIPYFSNSPLSIAEYYKAQKEEINRHLDIISSMLSESNANSDLINTVQSLKEQVEA